MNVASPTADQIGTHISSRHLWVIYAIIVNNWKGILGLNIVTWASHKAMHIRWLWWMLSTIVNNYHHEKVTLKHTSDLCIRNTIHCLTVHCLAQPPPEQLSGFTEWYCKTPWKQDNCHCTFYIISVLLLHLSTILHCRTKPTAWKRSCPPSVWGPTKQFDSLLSIPTREGRMYKP